MDIEHGYGTMLTENEFADDAAYRFLSELMLDWVHQMYVEKFSDSSGRPFALTGITAKAFAEDYVSEDNGVGLPALIVDTINSFHGLTSYGFKYADNCIYVAAAVPIDAKDKNEMLTQKNIDQMLSRYLDPLLADPKARIKCTHLNVNRD